MKDLLALAIETIITSRETHFYLQTALMHSHMRHIAWRYATKCTTNNLTHCTFIRTLHCRLTLFKPFRLQFKILTVAFFKLHDVQHKKLISSNFSS